ncbi:unnamed protein product, partial [Closterium sp. NIES-53]
SSLYTLATENSQVAASAQVSASGQVAASCSCRLLSYQTLLWHHRMGHPTLPRLRGMHSRLLVSGLPRSLPPLLPSPAPPCLPCVEGRQRAAPHSSSFPPTTAPLQTLHMDVTFLSCVCTLTEVQNGIAERRIGLVMEGSRAFVCDTSVDKLSPRAIPCVFLGFVPNALGWQFYHPTSRRVFSSKDVTFDESVPFYRLFPYRSAPPPPPPLFLALGPPAVDPLLPQGPAPSGAASGGAEPWGVESEGAETGPGGAASEGADSGGAEPKGAASYGGSAGASPRLSPQQLRELFVRRKRLRSGPSGAGVDGAAGAGGTRVAAGAGVPGGTATTGPGAGDIPDSGATGAGDTKAGGAGVGGTSAGGAGVGGPGVGGAGAGGAGAVNPAYFSSCLTCSHCSSRSSFDPPPVPGTHAMTLSPSPVSLRVPRPAPPESSLPAVPDPESERTRAASPTVSRLLATTVTDPSFESASASALVAKLLDFAAACRLDYATALVARSASASPKSVGDECALGTDVLEDRQEEFECLAAAVPRFASMLFAPEGDLDAPDLPTPRSYAEAITGPYSSQWQAAMDAKMASWKSTGTYVDEVPPPGANIVDGMWIFKVKQPQGSPPAFKAQYVARGFSQRQGVDFFHTFSPTTKMTTLRVLLHVAAQRDYELHSLDFSTAFLQGSLHEEIWLRRPPGFTESFPARTQWSLQRPVYGLHQAPREWHDTLRTTLAALGFASATADPSLFLRTDTSLPLFSVLVYVDDLVFATTDTEALTLVKSELQKRHTCFDLGELRIYFGLQITRDRARRTITLTQSHMVHQVLQRFGFQFSSQQPTPLSTSHSLSPPPSLSGSCCEAEIYAGAMAAQELRWLTYLLTDVGEQPRSPPILYVDNQAMIALCQEHRLEHRTKHIALRYFLARELQQRGQLCLAYVATRANTADVFTKALPPGDHQRFTTVLGLVPTLPHLLTP